MSVAQATGSWRSRDGLWHELPIDPRVFKPGHGGAIGKDRVAPPPKR
jgi:hypothetical protein